MIERCRITKGINPKWYIAKIKSKHIIFEACHLFRGVRHSRRSLVPSRSLEAASLGVEFLLLLHEGAAGAAAGKDAVFAD